MQGVPADGAGCLATARSSIGHSIAAAHIPIARGSHLTQSLAGSFPGGFPTTATVTAARINMGRHPKPFTTPDMPIEMLTGDTITPAALSL